jgi:hypothetical protein
MMSVHDTGLEVIEVQSFESKIVLVAKLIYGEIKTNMFLEANETGNLFQVIGIAFIPADAFAQGKRALILKPINHQEKLKKGAYLFSNRKFSNLTSPTDIANNTNSGKRNEGHL